MAARPFFTAEERKAVGQALKRIAGPVICFAALAYCLSLMSYDPADPGPFSATWREPTNWLGATGAWFADAAMRLFGLVALVIGLLGFGLGWRVLQDEPIWQSAGRMIATPFALIALCVFASAHSIAAPAGGGLGGLVGDFFFGLAMDSLPFQNQSGRLVLVTLLALFASLGLGLYAIGASREGVRKVIAHGIEQAVLLGSVLGAGFRDIAQASNDHQYATVADAPDPVWSSFDAKPDEQGGFGGQLERLGEGVSRRVIDWSDRLGALLGYGEPPLRAVPPAPRGFEPDEDEAPQLALPAPQGYEQAVIEPEPIEAVQQTAEPEGDEPETFPFAVFDPTADLELDPRSLADWQGDHPETGLVPEAEQEPEPEHALGAQETSDDFADTSGAEQLVFEDSALEAPVASEADPFDLREPGIDGYVTPALDLLAEPDPDRPSVMSEATLAQMTEQLITVLGDFGVRGEIVRASPGPVVTLFELEPAPGTKASRVINLADDIARSMSAVSARISTVPGRNVIGIELPNPARETVLLRELIAHPSFAEHEGLLPLALGKDIAGEPVVADLAKMPHLLIAGTTGSGKSVAINTMLLSLLYRLSPDQVRLIMIDPKMLELSVYNDIPHLLAPVVTDPKQAVQALKWVVREMETRYQKMAKLNVRGLASYNAKIEEAIERGEQFERVVQTGFDEVSGQPIYETEYFDPEPMPLIVVVVDEMADLMLVAGKEIEWCIQRLAQMARASGIHLIMATQRPSVDVITGTIKANFPIRISFQVTSKIDSRTILGEQGAEQLLGRGDMLYSAGGARTARVHGPFVSDDEVQDIVTHLRRLGEPDFKVEFASEDDEPDGFGGDFGGDAASDDDALYQRAVAIAVNERKASTSFIQRKLQIGYNRAARIVDQMEERGVVSPANHVGKREVLVGQAT
ncbi:MAG: DNA translocase FtsK [Neomegalonema sp.]|nr:DNA translocase FtsK [Neomegalonema sp.]